MLLELSASTFEQSRNDGYLNNSVNYKEDIRFLIERKDSVSNVIFVFGLCVGVIPIKKKDYVWESLVKDSYFSLS